MEGREKVLTWRKWHEVDDGGLWVALDTTLSAGAEAEYGDFAVEDPCDDKGRTLPLGRAIELWVIQMPNEMIYHAEAMETVDRHYHPRVGPVADLQKSIRKVAFKVHITNGLFKRISLRRHADRGERPAEMWCGRASEKEAFGFNTRGSKNQFFVTLAYPGRKLEFEPLFIKVAEDGEIPYFLKVEAHDADGGIVVVEVSLVSILKAPVCLRV